MVCPKHPARSVPAEHPVTAALAQLSPQGVTLRLAPHERTPSPTTFPLKSGQSRSLLQALKPLRDPRRFGGKRHRQVASIVAIATTALIAGNNHLLAIGQFAQTLSQHQLCALGDTRSRKTRQYLAPSETTLRRTLQRLDPDQLDTLVSDWLRSHLQDLDLAVLAVDGKCARTASKINGQSLTLFASLDTQTRLVRRQLQIPAKTNEIPALKDLPDRLESARHPRQSRRPPYPKGNRPFPGPRPTGRLPPARQSQSAQTLQQALAPRPYGRRFSLRTSL